MDFKLNNNEEIVLSKSKKEGFELFLGKGTPSKERLSFGIINTKSRELFFKAAAEIIKNFKFDDKANLSTQTNILNIQLSNLDRKYKPDLVYFLFHPKTAESLKGKIITVEGIDWVMQRSDNRIYLLPL